MEVEWEFEKASVRAVRLPRVSVSGGLTVCLVAFRFHLTTGSPDNLWDSWGLFKIKDLCIKELILRFIFKRKILGRMFISFLKLSLNSPQLLYFVVFEVNIGDSKVLRSAHAFT